MTNCFSVIPASNIATPVTVATANTEATTVLVTTTQGTAAEGTMAPQAADNAPVIAAIVVVVLLLLLGAVVGVIIALICYQKKKHGSFKGCLQRGKTNLLAIGEFKLPG